MRLRTKLLLVLVAGTAAACAVTYGVQRAVAHQQHAEELRVRAATGMDETVAEIERAARELEERARAWATALPGHLDRADLDAYVDDVVAPALESDPDVDRALVHAVGVAVRAARPRLADDERAALQDWLDRSAVTPPVGVERARAALLPTPVGPALVASLELVEADRSGPALRLVLLRAFDLAALEPPPLTELEDVRAWPMVAADLPEDVTARLPELRGRCDTVLVQEEGGGLSAYRTLADLDGRPAFLLRARAAPPPADRGRAAALESTLWSAAGTLLLALLALRFLDREVLRPVDELRRRTDRIGRSDRGRFELRADRRDEVGDLTRSLDTMLRRIEALHGEFVRSARIAGMSDVSMGVVHSVRSVLCSIDASTKLLGREMREFGVDDLRRMVEEIERNKDDLADYVAEDPKGRYLPHFLRGVTDSLEELHTRCTVELESVEQGIAHVDELVGAQERYASGAPVAEEADVTDLLDVALNISRLAHPTAREVEVVRDYGEVPMVRTDRHKLTTVFITVVGNALDAIADAPNGARRIELAVHATAGDRVVVEVTDDGVGIAPDQLDSLFEPGFTTKERAKGQGLHAVENICRELGISIGAHSDGVGSGSTFKLRVPLELPAAAAVGGGDAPVASAA